jgi:hypothetical protein
MNDQFESKMTSLCVAQKNRSGLRNSPAQIVGMACVSRLDLDHFNSQLDSPSFNQRLPRKYQNTP